MTKFPTNKLIQSIVAGMVFSMPAIEISAQSIRDSVELEPVVVTASHSPKALKDAPVVTRLITRHDIKITDATNIQDLLTQEMPGLEFGFAMSQETSLNMSGFGGNAILFLIDGERMAGETMDNVDYSRMNLDNVGRPMPTRAIATLDMNGDMGPVSRSTTPNGTHRPVSSTPPSTPLTCPRPTQPRRLPWNC